MRFRRKPQGLQGLTQIGQGLGTLDREVFEAVAESPSPLLDATMPRLSWAADHSKLWFVIAAALVATRHQATARGAMRGVASLAMTSLVTNQFAKRVWKRPRPNRSLVPLATAEPALPDVELAAVRALRQRRRIRRRCGTGEPSRRAGTGAARRAGRAVPRRRRRALPGRRVRRASASERASRCSAAGSCRRSSRPRSPPPIPCGWKLPRDPTARAWCW